VTEREKFLRALAENEDDTTLHLVYADWLEEQNEYEEADRQRKWPAAKQWLLRLCEQENPESDPSSCSYEDLIAFGQRVVTEEGLSVTVGDHMESAIQGKFEEFFQNWSVVTGIPLPSHLEKKSFFSRCCPGEEYWIGGAAPPREEEDSVAPPREEEDSSEWEKWDRVQEDLTQIHRKSSTDGKST
jgi:uncharacterized protein (TIGR02996 family)